MSDLPRNQQQPLEPEPLEPPEPDGLEPELDEYGDAIDPTGAEPELDEYGEPLEPDPDAEGEPAPQPRARGPRGRPNGETIRQLTETNAELQRRLAALEQRPAPQPQADPAAAQRADEQFWAELDLLPPAEAMRRVYARAQNETRQAFYQQQLTTQETLDRQQYDAKASTSRIHQQYRERVESLVASERQRGNVVLREPALAWLHWQDFQARSGRAAPAARRGAQARLAAQTVNPASGRSAVARGGGGRRDQDHADEALLRQTTVNDI